MKLDLVILEVLGKTSQFGAEIFHGSRKIRIEVTIPTPSGKKTHKSTMVLENQLLKGLSYNINALKITSNTSLPLP